MTKALLLDLDGTLLKNDLNTFTPVYFRALTEAVAPFIAAEPFLTALGKGVQAMLTSQDGTKSNEAVFWEAFTPHLTVSRETLEPLLARFYDEAFGTLSHVTEKVPGASDLVEAAREAGLKLVLATSPVFPRRAIEHRVEWAGLEAEAFDLVTSFETMHSTKPHRSYYQEIADHLDLEPAACVMAGNHLSDDLVGARSAGMRTFFVDTFPIADARLTPDGQGSLSDLRRWLFD